MPKPQKQIIDYYHTKESRWGYKFLLGGIKHFGYYPKSQKHISMKQAMQNMMDQVGSALDLPADNLVLDAGCGEGATALRLVDKYKLRVEGIDLLDFNIRKAKSKISPNLKDSLNFAIGDYTQLDFPDQSFDGVYTLETLVHAPDYKKALREFHRVLKNHGKLVLFGYSMPKQSDMSERQRWVFATVCEGSAMHSFPFFYPRCFSRNLTRSWFLQRQGSSSH